MAIDNQTTLRTHYPPAKGRAKDKTLAALDPHAINFIAHAPFVVLSTVNQAVQMDTSPRGGSPGFVRVQDPHTILIPDAKGNNRLDSLENILETGRVGTLFLIPGIDETLRINGQATLSDDSKLLALFPYENHPPKTCIVIHIEEVFLHCAKALMRSKLWDPTAQLERSSFPTMGQMLKDQLQGEGPIESQAEMVKRYEKDL